MMTADNPGSKGSIPKSECRSTFPAGALISLIKNYFT